ncbi:MAG: carbohydrate binding domain-containing protein [Bacilli bacterium]
MKRRKALLPLLLALFVIGGCQKPAPSTSESNGGDITTSKTDEHKVTWVGADDEVINLGDYFDLLEGVKAIDSIDGELEVVVAEDDYFDYHYVGQYTIRYEATNSKNTVYTKYRMIQVNKGPNVLNGSFTIGKNYWRFDRPGGAGDFNVVNEEAVFSITDSGAEAWAIQLYQTGIQFSRGKTYEMTFKAKSNAGRSISAGFENVSAGYAMLIPGYPAMILNSEYQEYSALYTASDDFGAIKAVLYLGRGLDVDGLASRTNPQDITVDDIKIREISLAEESKRPVFSNANPVTVTTGEEFEVLPAVTAVDYKGNDISDKIERIGVVPQSIGAETRMLISYRVSDAEGNFNFVNRTVTYRIARDNPYNLINSDFDNGFQGWTRDVNQTNGTGQAEFVDNEDGTVTATIINGSNDNWHIQLFQSNVSLEANKIYRTTLIAKASVERKLTLEISNPAMSFARIATELIDLTTEYQTFIVEFKSTVTTLAKFSLLLGNQGANKVDIDRFANEMITADEAQTIDLRPYEDFEVINGDFKYGYYGWTKEATQGADIVFHEDRDNEAINLEIVSAGSANWHGQINQDGKVFKEGVTYTMTVVASSVDATTITMEVTNNNGETVLGRQDITLSAVEETFTLSFTPSQDFERGKVSLLLGESALTTITVKGVTITK